MIKELLAEGDKKSMMRFGVLVILGIITLFAIVIATMLIVLGFKCSDTLKSLEFWGGISIFIGTLLLNGGVFLGVKAYQKKYEKTNVNPLSGSSSPDNPSGN